MEYTTSSLNKFYDTNAGRILVSEVSRSIKNLVNIKGGNLLAIGIGGKYLDVFDYGSSFYAIPKSYPFEYWPKIRPFRTVVVDETSLPFMPDSMDTIIVIHLMEFSNKNPYLLQDIFRILKTGGSLIVISVNSHNAFYKNSISKKCIKHNIGEIINFISDASFSISNVFGINRKFRFWPYSFSYNFNKYNEMLISFFPFLSDIVIIASEKIESTAEAIGTLDAVSTI